MRWSIAALTAAGLALTQPAAAQNPFAQEAFEELERESLRYREAELPPPLTPAPAPPVKAPPVKAPVAAPATQAPPPVKAPVTQAPPPVKTPPVQAPPETPAPAAPGLGDLDARLDLRQLDEDRLGHAIVLATNQARERHGLKPVPVEPRLMKTAQIHAERMARLGFFSHDDPHDARYRTPGDRARLAGIANPFIAENILTQFALQHDGGALYVIDRARGQFSTTPRGAAIPFHTYRSFAARAVQRWLDSPGHRKNLLSPNGLQMGAGAAVMPAGSDGFPKLTGVQVFQWFQPAR